MIAIRRPGCSRFFSHHSDASGRLDPHRTDDDRASAGLIGDDRDHHLPDLDRTAGRLRGRIPRSRCDRATIVAHLAHLEPRPDQMPLEIVIPSPFRLDCEAIGAGLITNFSLISSNFPLEFRTSTRKNTSKFASIHKN